MSKLSPKSCVTSSTEGKHVPGRKNEHRDNIVSKLHGLDESLKRSGALVTCRKVPQSRLCSVLAGKHSTEVEELVGPNLASMLMKSLCSSPTIDKNTKAKDPRLLELEPLSSGDREAVTRICTRSGGIRTYLNPESPEHESNTLLYFHFPRDKLANHSLLSMHLELSSTSSRAAPEATSFLLCVEKNRPVPAIVIGGTFEESLSAWDLYIVDPFLDEVEVMDGTVSVIERV